MFSLSLMNMSERPHQGEHLNSTASVPNTLKKKRKRKKKTAAEIWHPCTCTKSNTGGTINKRHQRTARETTAADANSPAETKEPQNLYH